MTKNNEALEESAIDNRANANSAIVEETENGSSRGSNKSQRNN